jgi:hypothetical protein
VTHELRDKPKRRLMRLDAGEQLRSELAGEDFTDEADRDDRVIASHRPSLRSAIR